MSAALMDVVAMSGPGGPEVLHLAQRPRPQPGPREVLVEVAYAGVNGPDLMQRRGLYPAPEGASDLLGLEVAGEVVAVGEGARAWQVGDRVCGLTQGGGYARFCTILEDHCLPVPLGMTLAEAASLPEAWFTVWSNIFMTARLAACEVFLVHGAAGGLGTVAIQLGKAFGARVIATDSPASRLESCKALGAERVVDYQQEDYVEVVRSEFGGADVILDIVGGPYVQRNMKAARHDARIVQLAFALGSKVQVDLMPVMLKRLHYTGSTLRTRPDGFKAEVARQLRAQVWPLFESGRLKSVVGTILPLAEAAQAHRLMETAGHCGKIVLKT
ncbi:NAD(P)H-quinone oxidoreductase [Ottowia sp.]|uniref:NAD(P)H-quinone oxidoreductase n=1 Tax=Ottowia sp. TaxID=1898956 RepID=UPI0025E05793|nr:NAD(P)H-quinone oxidoreductase [Ottowia sp.]